MIDINKTNADNLTAIKGIGKVTAKNIIKYREKEEGFENLEELKNVKGIGETTFKQIKSELIIGKEIQSSKQTRTVTIEFDPDEVGIEDPEEVHLVGEMNDWNPQDKSYKLYRDKQGKWNNQFKLKPGTEYKIMYDSESWEENKYVGFYGENFQVQ